MHHRDARSYYEGPNSQFPPGPYPSSNTSDYSPSPYHHASYDYQPNAPSYYPPSNTQSNDVPPSHPCYRSMTPAIHSHRYSNSSTSNTGEYYSASGILNSSSTLQSSYSNQGYYNNSQYSGLENRPPSNHTQFIPTPSEMAHSYSDYHRAVPPHSPQGSPNHYGPGINGYPNPVQVLPQPQHPLRPSRISTGRPRTASGATTSPTSATSPSGERFPCEKCGKTFSRSHDRKRHHETQHLPTPVIHRCRYCEKEFSRADSLKRHLDNGCDEMPQ